MDINRKRIRRLSVSVLEFVYAPRVGEVLLIEQHPKVHFAAVDRVPQLLD